MMNVYIQQKYKQQQGQRKTHQIIRLNRSEIRDQCLIKFIVYVSCIKNKGNSSINMNAIEQQEAMDPPN